MPKIGRRRIRARAAALTAESRVRFLGLYLMLFSLGLLVVFAIVHTQVRDNDLRYQIRSLQRQRTQLEKENASLAALAQELSSPERITLLAKTDLGMTLPPSQAVALLFVQDDVATANTAAVTRVREELTWMQQFLAWVDQGKDLTAAEG